MGRKTLIRSKEHPYHITARVNNQQPFPCNLQEAWKIHIEQLVEIESRFSVKIHAFVLMDNHFHLLISTPEDDLGIVMQQFMRSVTKIMNSRTGRSGRIFGAKYHWSLINSMNYFDCALKYIYRNPVKAKRSVEVTQYPFSTLNAALGKHRLPFQIHPPTGETSVIPNRNEKDFVTWLNIPFVSEEDREIKNAFQKPIFNPWIVLNAVN
jgi:putative transposase